MLSNTMRSLSANVVDIEGHENPLKFIWLEITRKCNLECVHCYENSGPNLPLLGSMTTKGWVRVIEDAADIGVEMIQFIGGEPTLFPDLGQLIEVASRLKMKIEVYTNGTTIKDRLWSIFAQNHVSLAFSYYSDDPQQHDEVTTKIGSHTKTRSAIERAVGLGLEVRVGVIQMPGASETSLDLTIADLRKLGVKNIGADRTRGIGRGVIKLSAVRNPFGELCGKCGNGRVVIDNRGHVYPCVMSKFSSLGHVSAGLRNLMQGHEMGRFREKLYEQQPELRLETTACMQCYPPCAPV